MSALVEATMPAPNSSPPCRLKHIMYTYIHAGFTDMKFPILIISHPQGIVVLNLCCMLWFALAFLYTVPFSPTF